MSKSCEYLGTNTTSYVLPWSLWRKAYKCHKAPLSIQCISCKLSSPFCKLTNLFSNMVFSLLETMTKKLWCCSWRSALCPVTIECQSLNRDISMELDTAQHICVIIYAFQRPAISLRGDLHCYKRKLQSSTWAQKCCKQRGRVSQTLNSRTGGSCSSSLEWGQHRGSQDTCGRSLSQGLSPGWTGLS